MNWKTLVFVLGCIGAVVYGLTAPPAESFANPDMARILFFRLPCAFVTTGLIVHSAWLGMRFLQTRDHGFDARNAAATDAPAATQGNHPRRVPRHRACDGTRRQKP